MQKKYWNVLQNWNESMESEDKNMSKDIFQCAESKEELFDILREYLMEWYQTPTQQTYEIKVNDTYTIYLDQLFASCRVEVCVHKPNEICVCDEVLLYDHIIKSSLTVTDKINSFANRICDKINCQEMLHFGHVLEPYEDYKMNEGNDVLLFRKIVQALWRWYRLRSKSYAKIGKFTLDDLEDYRITLLHNFGADACTIIVKNKPMSYSREITIAYRDMIQNDTDDRRILFTKIANNICDGFRITLANLTPVDLAMIGAPREFIAPSFTPRLDIPNVFISTSRDRMDQMAMHESLIKKYFTSDIFLCGGGGGFDGDPITPIGDVKNKINKLFGRNDDMKKFQIKKVFFNNPVTVVLWEDGTKTIVRCAEGDKYDLEKGLALCFMKKALGNNGDFNDIFKKEIYRMTNKQYKCANKYLQVGEECGGEVYKGTGKESKVRFYAKCKNCPRFCLDGIFNRKKKVFTKVDPKNNKLWSDDLGRWVDTADVSFEVTKTTIKKCCGNCEHMHCEMDVEPCLSCTPTYSNFTADK